MSDLVEDYLGSLVGFSPQTVRERGYVLRRADRELPRGLEEASPRELRAWLGAQPLGRWSFVTYWEDLFSLYAVAVEQGWLDWNPMVMLPRPRVPASEPRPVTEEQLAVAMTIPRPWLIAVLLAAFAGLRCAEIARLKRAEVTADWIRVERKGGKIQILPNHPVIWEAVKDLPSGPAVPRTRGGHFAVKGLSSAVSQRLTAVGLAEVTLHWFRHRYATIMLLPEELGGAGADVRTVQELLGHASLASTQVYTQVTSRARRAAVLALPVPAAVA